MCTYMRTMMHLYIYIHTRGMHINRQFKVISIPKMISFGPQTIIVFISSCYMVDLVPLHEYYGIMRRSL